MRVCFVADEIFHWGRYGGFGSLTRTIGQELVKKGVEVFVIMPQSASEQRMIESLDGMTIVGIPSKRRYFSLTTIFSSGPFFKLCQADIYHSEEPSVGTYLAIKAEPKKKHLVTFQDPRDIVSLKTLWNLDFFGHRKSLFRKWLQTSNYRIEDYFIKKSVHKANSLFCQAKFIIPKTALMYDLKTVPSFLPNPVRIPKEPERKAKEPTVCFLARLDKVKQPELFFKIATHFPYVKFIIAGTAHNKERNLHLSKISKNISNLECRGFVDEKTKSDILRKSWVYVNTSIRECLPVAFLEAAAHKCAILSSENPDDFAMNFGCPVENSNLASYIEGLKMLLNNDLWKTKGESGYRYVKEVHEIDKVIDQHIEIYRKLLE